MGVGPGDDVTERGEVAGERLFIHAFAELDYVGGGAADELGLDPLGVGALGDGELLDAQVGVEAFVVAGELVEGAAQAAFELPVGEADHGAAVGLGAVVASEDAKEGDEKAGGEQGEADGVEQVFASHHGVGVGPGAGRAASLSRTRVRR